jgi:CBS domain-containing protein
MEKVAGGPALELMNSHFPTASPDEELDNVLHRQLEHDIEDMVVVDSDGVLLGAVSLTAVLKALRDANRRTRG